MRTLLLLLLPAATLGCRAEIEVIDDDADGFAAEDDCNDADAAINPDAAESCDGIDNNCDGDIDESGDNGETFYRDGDSDGYGDSGATKTACAAPEGYVTDRTDCDDGDRDVHPGATESDCTDDTDYNCDGSSGFADKDSDGVPACEDCDDNAKGIYPGATETCDGIDNDCDGSADEDGSLGASTWFQDKDGDGFGSALTAKIACAAPEGYVAEGTDCNDASAAAYPGGVEICDGVDNDCNGNADGNDATDAKTWYADADRDGFGSNSLTQTACKQPTGFVDNQDDCDDSAASAKPGGTETCDAKDNDCDGTVDNGFDADGDGYTSCGGDCKDGDPAINPGAEEKCDSADNDCDGKTDEDGATGGATWYIDYDGDGYGSDKFTLSACSKPSGYVATKDDCNDLDKAYSPGAKEGCDGDDYNCDGEVDNDGDGDGYPAGTCGGDDCDDKDPDVKPEIGGNCAMGKSCLEILTKGLDDGDGRYLIDIDGYGTGVAPFEVQCDMTRAGGGWTMGLKAWYGSGVYRNTGALGSINDAMTTKGNNYKLTDQVIRSIIGTKENFDVLADQAGYNSGYSTGNYEYVVLRNYTGYWRFDLTVAASKTTTSFESYRQADNALMWKGNFTCGTYGGAGINCYDLASGSTNPAGGSGCTVNLGTQTNGGWHHYYMSETNSDTYMYICNGAQHSSSYNMNHRFWFREHVK